MSLRPLYYTVELRPEVPKSCQTNFQVEKTFCETALVLTHLSCLVVESKHQETAVRSQFAAIHCNALNERPVANAAKSKTRRTIRKATWTVTSTLQHQLEWRQSSKSLFFSNKRRTARIYSSLRQVLRCSLIFAARSLRRRRSLPALIRQLVNIAVAMASRTARATPTAVT